MDVALEKDNLAIACEIAVSSTPEKELGNVQKCLAAGFDHVVSVSSDNKTLRKAKELVSAKLSEQEIRRVQFLTPEDLFSFVETLEAEAAGAETKVRGYKVKVKYRPVGEDEKKSKRQAISQVIVQALKRFKGSDK